MPTKAKFRKHTSEAIHSSAVMLYKVGGLDKATMRDFDARHVVIPVDIESAETKGGRHSDEDESRS